MNRKVHHTIVFNANNSEQIRTNKPKTGRLSFLNKNRLGGTNSLYLLQNAIGRIYQILRYIELSGPYIDKYGPVIKEMPTMYKLMKAINEISNETDDDNFEIPVLNEGKTQIIKQSTPKLYI